MKKLIALFLAMILVLASVSVSFAEEEKPQGLLDSIGSFFSDTWNDVSGWVSGAWEDAGKWIDGAWGDASKWVEQAWNDSSTWVSDIWGDASTWVSDTVSTWWTNTFNTVTEESKDVWAWIKDNAGTLKDQGTELIEDVKSSVSAAGDVAEEKVQETIITLLGKLGLNDSDADKVWDTIKAYAEQKGISPVSVAKLALPYLLQLCADSGNQTIPAVAVAQYLTGIIEKLGINDNADADEIISQLSVALSGI